jgi:hypothetical protein
MLCESLCANFIESLIKPTNNPISLCKLEVIRILSLFGSISQRLPVIQLIFAVQISILCDKSSSHEVQLATSQGLIAVSAIHPDQFKVIAMQLSSSEKEVLEKSLRFSSSVGSQDVGIGKFAAPSGKPAIELKTSF